MELNFSSSVLIASFKRPQKLAQCLYGLEKQSKKPDEVIVIWQADDADTQHNEYKHDVHFV